MPALPEANLLLNVERPLGEGREVLIYVIVVSHRRQLQKPRHKHVQRVSHATQHRLGREGVLVGELGREVRLLDPYALISNTLSFESGELKCDIQVKLHYLVGPGRQSGDRLEIFSEHRVARARIRSVSNFRSVNAITLCEEARCAGAEEQVDLVQVSSLLYVRGAGEHDVEHLVVVNGRVSLVDHEPLTVQAVARELEMHAF